MINSADISGRFPLDAQSIDKVRLHTRREPGKTPAARQFEGGNMLMKSMRDTTKRGKQSDGDQTLLHIEMPGHRSVREFSTGVMLWQLPRAQRHDGAAENIAAERQAFAVPLYPPPPVIDCARETGKAQEAFVLRLDRGGGHVFEMGTYEPWRENG